MIRVQLIVLLLTTFLLVNSQKVRINRNKFAITPITTTRIGEAEAETKTRRIRWQNKQQQKQQRYDQVDGKRNLDESLIPDPVVSFTPFTVTFSYTIDGSLTDDSISLPRYTNFQCKSGSPDNDMLDNATYVMVTQTMNPAIDEVLANGETVSKRLITLEMKFQPRLTIGSAIYYPGNTTETAIMEFCVGFVLHNGWDNKPAYGGDDDYEGDDILNEKESMVTLNMEVGNVAKILSADVNTKEEAEETSVVPTVVPTHMESEAPSTEVLVSEMPTTAETTASTNVSIAPSSVDMSDSPSSDSNIFEPTGTNNSSPPSSNNNNGNDNFSNITISIEEIEQSIDQMWFIGLIIISVFGVLVCCLCLCMIGLLAKNATGASSGASTMSVGSKSNYGNDSFQDEVGARRKK